MFGLAANTTLMCPALGTMKKTGKRALRLSGPTIPSSESTLEAIGAALIIETPKGSRNKYAFDEKQWVFALRKYCRPEWHFRTILVSHHRHLRSTATRPRF